jgi:hypothetical protein
VIFGDVLTVDEVIGAFSADKGAGSL